MGRFLKRDKKIAIYLSYTVVLIVIVGAFGFLLADCISIFGVSAIKQEETVLKIAAKDSIRNQFYEDYHNFILKEKRSLKPDSKNNGNYSDKENSKQIVHLDSIVDNLICRVAILEKQQDESLADLRQEGNNYVNRVNGWFGFWITVMAILVGIIPIAIQYILNYKTDQKVDEIIRDLKEKVCASEVQALVASINITHDQKIIQNNITREFLINSLIHKINDAFSEIIKLEESHDSLFESNQNTSIIAGLIHYCSLIDLLKLIHTQDRRFSRRLTVIDSQVKIFLSNMQNNNFKNKDEMWQNLMAIWSQLRSLQLVAN